MFPNFITNRPRFPVAVVGSGSELQSGGAQVSVEAGLAVWADGQAYLLAEAHQKPIQFTPEFPVDRGMSGRRVRCHPLPG